ncbi:MAG: hypothetical protein U0T56_12685 [Ferruginibacter sp.]
MIWIHGTIRDILYHHCWSSRFVLANGILFPGYVYPHGILPPRGRGCGKNSYFPDSFFWCGLSWKFILHT